MTLEYLQSFFDLKGQIRKQQELIDQLWDAAYPGAQKLDGMPHSHEPVDKVGNLAVEIAALEERMEETKEACKDMEGEIFAFFDSIEDPYICTVFRLRFYQALRWREVAAMLHTTEDAARELCYSYLLRIS